MNALNRHLPIIGAVPPSTRVQTAPEAQSNPVQTLDYDAAICDALREAGLTHGQACAYMCDEDGKPLDQSQWTRMRKDGIWPMKRMRNLPLAFWQALLPRISEPAGLAVTHEDLADIALKQTAVAIDALVRTVTQLRATRRIA